MSENEENKQNSFVKDIFTSILKMPSTMKKLGLFNFLVGLPFVMWSLATPALTEHVFKAPSPIVNQYNMQIEDEAHQFELDNKKYQDAADLVGLTWELMAYLPWLLRYCLHYILLKDALIEK